MAISNLFHPPLPTALFTAKLNYVLSCDQIASLVQGPGFRKYPKICHKIYLRTNFMTSYNILSKTWPQNFT